MKKVAIAVKTCGTVYSLWGEPRIVDADKPTIMFTCLNSLLKTIAASKNEIIFSIHDDSSTEEQRNQMQLMVAMHGVKCEFIDSGKKNNFKTQYHWLKEQDCDYVYLVEDDYLHVTSAIDDMIDMCEYMKVFWPGDYAVFPMNHPHRYHSVGAMNPSYIIKGPKGYWRSAFHTTATFLMSKEGSIKYDSILKEQAYMWEINGAPEDKIINRIWREQETRLIYPMETLAWHISDESNRDEPSNWKQVWNENEILQHSNI
jgi:hypothetical protein